MDGCQDRKEFFSLPEIMGTEVVIYVSLNPSM